MNPAYPPPPEMSQHMYPPPSQQPPPPRAMPTAAPPMHHNPYQQQQQHQHQHHHLQPQLHHQHPRQPSIIHHHQPPPLSSSAPPRQDDASMDKTARIQGQLNALSRVEDPSGRKYHLDVVQQPKRARMCGYGDKDRRPITPPPCVRLIITDFATGEEVNCKDIDFSMFVLNVDLWNELGAQEVNLCRQPSSSGTPSISSTQSYGYSPNEPIASVTYTPVLSSNRSQDHSQPPPMGYIQDYQPYSQAPSSYPTNGTYGPPQQYYPQQGYRPDQGIVTLPSQRYDSVSSMGSYVDNGPSVSYVHDQYKGALNRNLIGSVAASAFCLTDTADHEGIWFVLQDLSVRLEGTYRLKFSFVNVGSPQGGSRDTRGPSTIIKGKAPILASCYSDAFNVYSAKKFPGVCESTALSKTFATQGIKIPIRKDGNKGGDDEDAE